MKWLATLAFVTPFSTPLAAFAWTSSAGRWSVNVEGQIGLPRGTVQVRENQIPGDRLRLHGDLGIDVSERLSLAVGYRARARDRFVLSLDSIFLYGSAALPRDVRYNGATFAAGTGLRSRPEFFRVNVGWERDLSPVGSRAALAAGAGLEYVLLTYRIRGTLARNSDGNETKEDFVTQELPVPILSIRGTYPLLAGLELAGRLAGGYLPRVDSLRSEGGDVKLAQSHAEFDLALRFSASPRWSLEGGYRYTYFFQHEISREDDNEFSLSDNALFVSAEARF